MLVIGEPGCGKTAVAAWLAGFGAAQEPGAAEVLARVRGSWAAIHFCFAEERRRSVHPARFAQALASQISGRFIDFARFILEPEAPSVVGQAHANTNWGTVIGTYVENLIIKAPNAEDVYERSVRKPLEKLYQSDPAARVFILVDSLDEALTVEGTTIVDLVAGSVDLPANVRFLLTSRNDPGVTTRFPRAHVLDLSHPSSAMRANADIRVYVQQRNLPGITEQNVDTLVAGAAGNFLYVKFLLEEVASGKRAVNDLASLPLGLHALYHTSLNRVTRRWRSWSTRFQPLLGRLSVAATDVPQGLLGDWTAKPNQIAATLNDIFQLVESTPTPDGVLRYRLYHRSMADFLALSAYRTNGSTLPNRYHTPPFPQNKAIVDFYLRRFDRNWHGCDEYGLRNFIGHLYACIDGAPSLGERDKAVSRLYRTLLDPGFANAQQQILGELAAVLGDLRTGLRVALRENDLAKAVTFLGRHREAQRAQGIAPAVFAVVVERKFSVALRRAEFYQSVPNWGRSLFLYLAWEAAREGDLNATRAAIEAAWNSPISKGPYFPQNNLSNALFTHIAQLLSQRPDSPHDAVEWMRQLDPTRPDWDIDACLVLIQPALPMEERDFREALSQLGGLQIEFARYIEAQGYHTLGEDFANAEAVAFHADHLAQLFRKLAPYRVGQESIDRALDAVVKNPYPAYRDVALVALGSACLSATDMPWVAKRLQRILQAALDQEGVTFTFDLAAMLTHEAARRKLSPERLGKYCEQAHTAADSWGTRLRALSARGAALFRQGDRHAAFKQLDLAAEQRQGFAGYFSLHCLALANRWWEFGEPNRVRGLIRSAAEYASHVENYEFRLQREQLVQDYDAWCAHKTPTVPEALDRLNAISAHDTRMAYLDHVSARWAASEPPNLEALETALPFVVSDATALDTMLARFIGLRLTELNKDDLVEAMQACNQFLTTGRPWEFSRGEKPVPRPV